MPHEITKNPDFTVEINASLGPEEVSEEREHIVRSLRGQARIPGFRPGKAPLSAIRARYAEEIKGDLTEHLASRLWRQVLEEEDGFEPLTPPEFEALDFDDNGGFSLRARLEVRPQWDLPSLEGVTVPEFPTEVEDTEVETELERICDEQATWEPTDDGATAADGMMVEADVSITIEGAEEDPKVEENAQIVVGAEGVPPEISEALQGASAGQTKVVDGTISKDPDDDAELEDPPEQKNIKYSLDVKSIKVKAVPEADDELAKNLGLEDLAELKERIQAALKNQKMSARRDGQRRHILDHLEVGMEVENLPPTLVNEAVNEDLQRFAYQMAMQGQAPDMNEADWHTMRARIEPAARKRVLDSLILEQLAQEWEVAVPEQDVDDYIAAEAQRQNIPSAEHKANLAAENKIEQIRHAARMAETVTELLRRSGVEEEE